MRQVTGNEAREILPKFQRLQPRVAPEVCADLKSSIGASDTVRNLSGSPPDQKVTPVKAGCRAVTPVLMQLAVEWERGRGFRLHGLHYATRTMGCKRLFPGVGALYSVGMKERIQHHARWAGGVAGRALQQGLDFLLPERCLSCGTAVRGSNALCGSCWAELQFITDPRCAISGVPFPFDGGEGAVSAAVLASRPAYDRARAALRYNGASGRLISRLKYGDRLEAVPLFARWMIQAGAALVEDADVIAPVPLHPSRLFARRFNQSAELARAIGRLSGKDVEPDLMQRIRATPAQVGLSAAARRRNVAGAFALTEGKGAKVAEARVLLIDDVLTTGATVEACARRLGAEGAAHVDVLTLARVVPGEALPI